MTARHYAETLLMLLTDGKYASYQDYDPELLLEMRSFMTFPKDIRDFCLSQNKDGTEPYFEDVLTFTRLRYLQELEKELRHQEAKGYPLAEA